MKKLLLLAAPLITFSSLQAVLVVQEDFTSYATGEVANPGGDPVLGSYNGGTGWAAGWQYVNPSPGGTIIDYSWDSFTGYGHDSTRAFSSNDSATAQFKRELGTAIDVDAEGTYYFSYLFNNATGFTNIGFSNTINTPDTSILAGARWRDGAKDYELYFNGTGSGDTGVLANHTDYLIVGRIITSASDGGDSLAIAYYTAGQDVSTEANYGVDSNTIVASGDFSADFTRWGTVTLGGATGDNSKIGTFTLATDYQGAITAIPEPSTYVLLTSLFVGAIVALRRKA